MVRQRRAACPSRSGKDLFLPALSAVGDHLPPGPTKIAMRKPRINLLHRSGSITSPNFPCQPECLPGVSRQSRQIAQSLDVCKIQAPLRKTSIAGVANRPSGCPRPGQTGTGPRGDTCACGGKPRLAFLLPFSRLPSAKSRALPGSPSASQRRILPPGRKPGPPLRPVRLTGRWPKSLVAPDGAFSEACAGRERLRLNRPRRGPAPVGCVGETAPRRFRSRRAGRPRAVGAESLPDSCPAHRQPPLPAVAIPCAGAIR